METLYVFLTSEQKPSCNYQRQNTSQTATKTCRKLDNIISKLSGNKKVICHKHYSNETRIYVNPAVRVAANGRVGRLSSKQHGEDTNHVAPDRERHPNRDSWRMSFLMDPADSPRRLSCKNGSQRLWVDQTLCTNTYFMLGALQKSFNNRSLQMVFTVLLVLYIGMLFQGLSA